MKQYWSKFSPGVTAQVFGAPDYRGLSLAMVEHLPEADGPVAATITLAEWSEVEVIPTPETVPNTLYLVISGDVDHPVYGVADTEVKAAVMLSKKKEPLGYVPISVPRILVP